MKSSTINRFGLPNYAKDDLISLSKIPEEKIVLLLEWFSQKKAFPPYEYDEIESLSDEADIDGTTCASFLTLMRFFFRAIVDNNDSAEDLVDDIRTLGVMEDEKFSQIEVIFKRLPVIIKGLLPQYREFVSKYSGQPFFKWGDESAVIKPVYHKRFKYGSMNIADYRPELLCYTVVGQIEIEASQEGKIAFQIDIDELDRWLTSLLALQAEMVQLSQAIKDMPKKQDD